MTERTRYVPSPPVSPSNIEIASRAPPTQHFLDDTQTTKTYSEEENGGACLLDQINDQQRPRPLEIHGHDVVEIADEAEDLTGIILVVRVVLQGIDCAVVNVESSALVGHALALDDIHHLLR